MELQSKYLNSESVSNSEGSSGLVEKTPGSRFYRVVWRWHFYAGLFVIPFVVMLAVTGAIYLFKPQLNHLIYGDRLFVTPQSEMLPFTQQLAAAQAAFPGAKPQVFRPAPAPDRSSETDLLTENGRLFTFFVNPYDGRVLGRRDGDYNLQAVAKALHGELMMGRLGDALVELAACWGLVLAVTGVYLWWPRNGASVWGTLLPRLVSMNKRIFWRDLHACAGFYGSTVIVFMILTGLPWADFWGKNFDKITHRVPHPMFAAFPTSTVPTGVLNERGERSIPWAAEQMPMPKSDPSAGAHAQHGGSSSEVPSAPVITQEGIPPGTSVNLDSVIMFAWSKGFPNGLAVNLPQNEEGVYTVSITPNDPRGDVVMHIDQYSGDILGLMGWAQYGFVSQAVSLGIALHEGRFFGLGNQLLMLFAALSVLTLAVTATVMWWKRRPIGRLGAPAMPQNFPLWKGAVVLIGVMGVLFPLMGISLVAVLLLDYLVIARLPTLKRALS
jgi:uncharacterized iron-regulated membrane protein